MLVRPGSDLQDIEYGNGVIDQVLPLKDLGDDASDSIIDFFVRHVGGAISEH